MCLKLLGIMPRNCALTMPKLKMNPLSPVLFFWFLPWQGTRRHYSRKQCQNFQDQGIITTGIINGKSFANGSEGPRWKAIFIMWDTHWYRFKDNTFLFHSHWPDILDSIFKMDCTQGLKCRGLLSSDAFTLWFCTHSIWIDSKTPNESFLWRPDLTWLPDEIQSVIDTQVWMLLIWFWGYSQN